MADLIAKDVAQKEVTEWLDRMDIPAENRERENVRIYIECIVDAIMKGFLIFNPDETVTQKLKSPLGEGATKELHYDFRYEIGEYKKAMKGISIDDEVGWATAKLSLVSADKLPASAFLKLKRSDYGIASKLTIFF